MSEIKRDKQSEDGIAPIDTPETQRPDQEEQNKSEPLISSDKRIEFIKKYYGLIALFAGLMGGIQTFLYEVIIYTKVDSSTMSLLFANFAAYYTFAICYHMKQAIQLKMKYGTFWQKEHSTYFSSIENESIKGYSGVRLLPATYYQNKKFQINKTNVIAITIRALCALCASMTRLAVIYTESKANLNFSLISNILALTPFIVAVMFYFAYKEYLNRWYLIGITLILTCAIMTSLSSASSSSGDSLSAAVPVLLAVLQAFLGAVVCLISRYIAMNTTISVQQQIADTYLFEGVVYMIIFFCVGFPYTATIFWCIGALSLVGITSILLVTMAVAYGKAAPSLALNDCSSLWTLLLEIIILQKLPTVLQGVAFFIGLGGAVLIALESRRPHQEEKQELTNKQSI